MASLYTIITRRSKDFFRRGSKIRVNAVGIYQVRHIGSRAYILSHSTDSSAPPRSFSITYFPATINIVIRHKTIIVAIHQGGGYHEIGGGAIAGNWNIPNYRHAQERLNIRIVGLRFERVPEKDEKVNPAVGYLGADLQISAQRSALEFVNLEAKLLFQNLTGCPCRVYRVMLQERLIVF